MTHHLAGEEASLGIIGFGAFGRLIAHHLAPFARVFVTDAQPIDRAGDGIAIASLTRVCACDIVVLAVPVGAMREACRAIAPLLRPGALVLDVGSVKIIPARILAEELPRHVELAATHPMFGPQSTRDGTDGLKMVICPLRGGGVWRIAAFLRKTFGLTVIFATPEEHDREAAVSQGLTHMIAGAMLRLDRLPGKITTRSFDLLREALEMVRHDAAGVGRAIALDNPFAAEARDDFLRRIDAFAAELRGL